jgi:hypothetical protein
MRFFSLVDFGYWALAVGFGLTSAILVYMAWGSYSPSRNEIQGFLKERSSSFSPSIFAKSRRLTVITEFRRPNRFLYDFGCYC